jgi:hypothetical protein
MPRCYAALQRCDSGAHGRGAPAVLAALVPPREDTVLPQPPRAASLDTSSLESLSKIIKLSICPFLIKLGRDAQESKG